MKITVYTTTTCPYCKMLKGYLSEKKLEFEEKLVDQDDNAREEMVSVSGGFMGVPYTIIDKGDGGEKIKVIGFDKAKLDEALGVQS